MRVVATSLPKSGTHLLVRLLELLRFRERKPSLMASLVRVTERNPFRRIAKKRRLWRPEEGNAAGLMVDLDEPENRIRRQWLCRKLKAAPDCSYVKAHLPYSEEMESLLQASGFKILFIIRDPRDVAVSYCNYVTKNSWHPLHKHFSMLPDDLSRMRTVFDGCVSPCGFKLSPLEYQLQNVMGWWQSEWTLSVRFEDLIGPDGGGSRIAQQQTVQSICEHLEVSVLPNELRSIVEQVFYRKARTFHKGAVGAWKGFSETDALVGFEHRAQGVMDRLGYSVQSTGLASDTPRD